MGEAMNREEFDVLVCTKLMSAASARLRLLHNDKQALATFVSGIVRTSTQIRQTPDFQQALTLLETSCKELALPVVEEVA